MLSVAFCYCDWFFWRFLSGRGGLFKNPKALLRPYAQVRIFTILDTTNSTCDGETYKLKKKKRKEERSRKKRGSRHNQQCISSYQKFTSLSFIYDITRQEKDSLRQDSFLQLLGLAAGGSRVRLWAEDGQTDLMRVARLNVSASINSLLCKIVRRCGFASSCKYYISS